MLSRSHILVEKEMAAMARSTAWGIEAFVINDNIYEWSVRMAGPPNSLWEGGIFRVYLKFDEHFNTRPPRVCFHTIPYHPNIDMITGRPCIDYLDDWELWDSKIRIENVLVQIQNLLCNPNLNYPVNIEAHDMLKSSPDTYGKVVKECVAYSVQIDSNPDFVSDRQFSLQNITTQPAGVRGPEIALKNSTKLSFDDYLAQWNGIGTSKPKHLSVNAYLEMIEDDPLLKRIHLGLSEQQILEEQFIKNEQFYGNYYGSEHKKKPHSAKSAKEARIAQINQMRKIYLPKKPLPTPRTGDQLAGSDREMDDLVAWTENLNPADLDAI